MKRYKCTVAYAGRNYAGWQTQNMKNSIQEVIEDVLFRLTKTKTRITGAGRTDAGVNASGQVFHFDTELVMTAYKWKGALNAYLPEDIRILSVEETNENFHARYNVLYKQYDYRINLGEYDVFTRDSVYQCPYHLDTEVMQEAAKYFLGTHDFTAFNSTSKKEREDQVRTVTSIKFTRDGDILTISYTGRGFLRYMVRMMSGMLIEAGRGKIPPSRIQEILEKKAKTTAVKNAPACGLTLVKVEYYQVLAANERLIVREFLPEDDLYGKTENTWAVCERNIPKVIACLDKNSLQIMEEGILTEEDITVLQEVQRKIPV